MEIEMIKKRSEVVKLMRQWFDNQGFLEMLTPRLLGLPGQEPYLEPFWTEVIDADNRPYPAALITSPEYSMKRLLAAGFDKIYDLGSCFRNNEPWDGTHDPEFLMIEWYRREAGVKELMDDTENMMRFISQHVTRNTQCRDSRFEIPASSFRRLTVEQAWREYAGVELAPLLGDREAMAKLAVEKFSQTVNPDDNWDDIYFKIFLSQIEEKLGLEQPTFLYRYPASQAALARRSVDDPRWAERVELYVGPFELANGFAELCDPIEQRQRFLEEKALRSKQGRRSWPLDERFLVDLPKMGNAAGIAFGVERLAMLLAGTTSINDILPFPARERFNPLPEKPV
ncbi:MAG: EF-P lysine aminoacylase EpmA [Patescibacteria group bacterium]|nr:EF-P lysine aminoacylase EpmA [Patescibacteria group bacterium]